MILIKFLIGLIFLFFIALQVYVWIELPFQTLIIYILIGLAIGWMIHTAPEMPEGYKDD